ncbi:hypothetical protein PANA5342_4289 [Pantoea ananatis LMG 5342]|jgi:hypothetical protein|nr:hypothetical protein PANA5342_4289 [Pantoea ananatis LMG 5342]
MDFPFALTETEDIFIVFLFKESDVLSDCLLAVQRVSPVRSPPHQSAMAMGFHQ